MRVLRKKKQLSNSGLRNEITEEIKSVEIREYEGKTYLKIKYVEIYEYEGKTCFKLCEEFFDTKDHTEGLYHKLLIDGYADLSEYATFDIGLDYSNKIFEKCYAQSTH